MAAVPSRPEEAACHSGAIFARSACLRRRRHTIRDCIASRLFIVATWLACEGGSRSIAHMAAIQPHPHDVRSHCTAAWCGSLSEGGRSMVACSRRRNDEESAPRCKVRVCGGWRVAITNVVRSARKPKPISCLHERGVGGASFPCEASCRAHAPPQPRGRGSERTIDARHERQGRTRTTGTGTPKGSGWSG
jgi:hypothetical protein